MSPLLRSLLTSFLMLLIVLGGCDSEGDNGGQPLLRIKNESTVDFSTVRVSFPGAEAHYGPLSAGETSPYQMVEQAYRYGLVEVNARNEMYRVQPIDYVGERPLPAGRYLFTLDLEGNDLTLEFEDE